jgi:asparagine synthase (glutamine-hydrolysing)
MCGILGIIRRDALKERDRKAIRRMAARLERRGPDGEGFHESGNALLGCRRLAIVDVENGKQPMTIDGLTIVLNGEIYNHEELRERLEGKGVRFETRCDTEVLLRLFQKHGERCLDMIDGQFAFAIWDEKKKEAFLARDRFGEKPLHIAGTEDGGIVFASTPGSILEHPDIKRGPDPYTLGFFMLQAFTFAAGDAPLDRSFFKGIRELPPGHYMTVSERGEEKERWYGFRTDEQDMDLEEAAGKVRDALSGSVRRRVAREVKNGVALSGGLDSSIVATIAREEDEGLVASSISFKGDRNDDLEHARLLAEKESMPLVETATCADRIREIIDRIVDALEAPHCMLRQIGMIENYRRLAEEGVKVALVGEGADELFFGYWHKFPGFKKDEGMIEKPDRFRELCRRRLDAVRRVFTDEFNQQMDYEGVVDEMCSGFERSGSADPRRKVQGFYLDNFLSAFLIRANDRLAMYNSIEARLPFLAKEVVEAASWIPPSLNISEDSEKMVLREAFRDMLPEKIAVRRKAPLPAALHQDFHREILSCLIDSVEYASPSVWRILRKERVKEMCVEFGKRLESLGSGEELVMFRPLDQEFQTSMIHIFSILTTLRWYDRHVKDDERTGEFQKPGKKFKQKRKNDRRRMAAS